MDGTLFLEKVNVKDIVYQLGIVNHGGSTIFIEGFEK